MDPDNPPGSDYYYLTSSLTYATFVIDPIVENGFVSGNVNELGSFPLSNAEVSIENTSIVGFTDVNGAYLLPGLPYGEYNVTASLFGYYDESKAVLIDAPTISKDFNLAKRAQVNVVGQVVGSNDVMTPLELVDVNIEGYIEGNTITNSNGEFSFSNIYGDVQDYQVTLFLYGYDRKVINAKVIDSTLDLGVIILDQELISPFDVEVENNNGVVVSWKSPQESQKVKIQNDFGYDSNAYSNEPNEEVWLGNIFSISDITTITSIEIGTFYIESVADYVSIDVIDLENNEVIASSQPFLIQFNATQVIDIPNIVVYEDIAVMVHWQNNEETTNFLNVDFSDPQIPNTAAIRYPNESIQLLSDFFENMQNQSFHVRLNTLDDGDLATNNEVLNYNVYRGFESEFPTISNWQLLNETPITNEIFEDTKLDNIEPNEIYRYAVETNYVEGNSEVTFSNKVADLILGIEDDNYILDQVKIYPIPTKDFLNISLPPQLKLPSSIKIHDVLGNQIEEIGSLNSQNSYISVDLTNYTKGIYFLKFGTGLNVFYRSFIVN